MCESKPTVFVVDDDVSVREALKVLIESAGWQTETFETGREFLARTPGSAPSCLLLDVALPDVNGCDLQKTVAERIDLPIIFMSGYADVPTTVRAMKGGAVDFLSKPFSADALLDAVRDAIERSSAILAEAAEVRAVRERYAALSLRERQVMALVVAGRLNKQVGWELGISEITVKAHRGHLMRKMEARSLPDLVNMAASLGLQS